MSQLKEYCDKNNITYIDLGDEGIAIDVATLTPKDMNYIFSLSDNAPDIDFNEFWDKYHQVTGLKKTDMQAAQKYWKKLTKKHKRLALENIEPYFNSLPTYNSGKPVKKARTYLGDKNFLDEFEVVRVGHPRTPDQCFRSDGKPAKISIDQVAVNNYAEWEQYCKENNYNPETGETLI